MYGRSSRFVDVDNINQITQTLNKLFLSENMVSWKKIEEDHQILYL